MSSGDETRGEAEGVCRVCGEPARGVACGQPVVPAPVAEPADVDRGLVEYERTVLKAIVSNVPTYDGDVTPDWIGLIATSLINARPLLAERDRARDAEARRVVEGEKDAWHAGAQAATDWIKSGAWVATMPENPFAEALAEIEEGSP